MKRQKRILTFIISGATLLMGIVSYFILPDKVAVQWSFSGQATNVFPKIVAILISFAVTALCIILSWCTDRNDYGNSQTHAKIERIIPGRLMWLGFIGVIIQIVFIIMNI